VKSLSSSFDSQESGIVMEAIEATQFNDLNDTMDKNTLNGIPIPDSGKNAQRNQQRRKKRAQKRVRYDSVQSSFDDFYELTGEILGEGSYAKVQGCIHKETGKEYAVKTVIKHAGLSRARVFKEIEIFYHCQGHKNIIQLIEFFEEEDRFFMIFEKINGGPLLAHIQKRVQFTENEASLIIKDLASALKYIHKKGIAHRDLKPENILCFSETSPCPVKICDFDLGSKVVQNESSPISTPTLLSPVGSPLFMSPEIASNFMGVATGYDKRCDLWSLGVIMYILLSGNPPFYNVCGYDCGWEKGDFCQLCQDLLFNSIQEGIYDFPENEWGYISDDAKDLIKHLLVKDASQRYTAEMVLKHRWVAQGGPTTPLETPSIMRKNNSYKDLEAWQNGANQIKRLILNQQNMSSDFKSTLENHIEEQYVGSYKNSSSLVLTDNSSPTFELHFTSDEDGDAFLSDLDQPINTRQQEQQEQQEQQTLPIQTITSSSRKAETKTVKWIDLQEEDDDFVQTKQTDTKNESSKATVPTTTTITTKAESSTPRSALKSSIDRTGDYKPTNVEIKKKKKKTIKQNSKTRSTTSSNSSSDESSSSSDYNNNKNKTKQYKAIIMIDGEDADIDEADSSDKMSKLVTVQKQKLQKMLECIENRKRLSLSASCYVISNKNNQTASLNFCPSVKSMLII